MLLMAGKAFGLLWPYLLGAAAIFGVWESGHHSGYKAEHQIRMDEHAAAVKRTSEIVTEQVRIRGEEETKAQGAMNELRRSFDGIKATAMALPGRAAPVGAGFVGVLNNAARAASATGAPADTGKEAASAAADLGAVTDWGVAVAELYGECVKQVIGLQDFYNRLRGAMREKP